MGFGYGIHLELGLRGLQRPGKMVNLDALNFARPNCVEAVALGDESLEIAFVR